MRSASPDSWTAADIATRYRSRSGRLSSTAPAVFGCFVAPVRLGDLGDDRVGQRTGRRDEDDARVELEDAAVHDVHGKASSTDAQQQWVLTSIRKPVIDESRGDRIYAEICALAGAYVMPQ